MAGFRAFGIALMALAAPASAAQDDGPATAAAAAPAAAAVQDVSLEIGGIRARVVLKSGMALEGLLPNGTTAWEKPAPSFDYQEAEASDPAAGLRLYFVYDMEGAIFLRKADITSVKDLGALSEDAAAAIRQTLLDERRKVVEEREARLKEILRRAPVTGSEPPPKQAGPAPAVPAPEVPAPAAATPVAVNPEATAPAPAVVAAPAPSASAAAGPLTKEDAARAKAEARRVRGEELLAKYPPPDWSESRLQTILWREQVAKIPPDEVEAPWVKENDVWLEALRRREAAEKKAAAGAAQGAAAPAGAGNPAPR